MVLAKVCQKKDMFKVNPEDTRTLILPLYPTLAILSLNTIFMLTWIICKYFKKKYRLNFPIYSFIFLILIKKILTRRTKGMLNEKFFSGRRSRSIPFTRFISWLLYCHLCIEIQKVLSVWLNAFIIVWWYKFKSCS